MKRLIIMLITCLYILVSCNYYDSDLKNEKDDLTDPTSEDHETLKNSINSDEITIKENIKTYDYMETSEYEDKSKYDGITFYTDPDKNINKLIVDSYLNTKKMYKEKSDEVLFYDTYKLADIYFDDDLERIAIILYMWNFDENVPQQFATSCLTVDIEDFISDGYIIYDYSSKEKKSNEYLYKNDDTLKTHISYSDLLNYSFPLINSSSNNIEKEMEISNYLNRNQKMWLFNDLTTIDSFGKIISYSGDMFREDMSKDPLLFSYDNEGKLMAINGSITSHDNYGDIKPFEMLFKYNHKGMLKKSTYHRPGILYGTSDSDGEILYDDKKRMVFNAFYVTHGSVSKFFFYKGDDTRPWAIVTYDSMAYGGWNEEDIQYEFGNYINIQLFSKEEI